MKTSTAKPSNTAAATTRACALSAAYACPSSTRRLVWPRTTATSGWRRPTADQVLLGGQGRGWGQGWERQGASQPQPYSLLRSRFGPGADLHVPRPLLEKETETEHPGGPQTQALRIQDRWVAPSVPGIAPMCSPSNSAVWQCVRVSEPSPHLPPASA